MINNKSIKDISKMKDISKIAMQGILSNPSYNSLTSNEIARKSIEIAEVMIDEFNQYQFGDLTLNKISR